MLNSYFLRPFILPACVLLQKKGLLPGDIGNSSTDSKPRHSPAQKAIDNNMAEAADPANHHTQAIFKNGRFQNPWPNYLEHTAKDIISLIRTKDLSNIPSKAELDETLPIVTPNFSEFNSSPACGVRVMWLGHASVLVQFDDVTVLTDPIFSPYCSPVSRIGPKRYRDPPCCVMDLPKVDAVVISHNHYDHLDVQSVKSLVKKFGEELMWYVPMGLASWMRDCGCKNVVELTWWDSATLPGRDDVRFVATPSKHWCNRGVFDRNKVLWASWAVIGPRHRFYFGGDTGYCAGFAEIGREFGPFDLAAIPIGAYYPRSFMESIHVNPDEAVKIHHDLKSKASIGIHWGTFKMTSEYYLEPKERLAEIIREQKMPPNSFVTLKHGEIHIVGGDSYRDVD